MAKTMGRLPAFTYQDEMVVYGTPIPAAVRETFPGVLSAVMEDRRTLVCRRTVGGQTLAERWDVESMELPLPLRVTLRLLERSVVSPSS